MLETRLVGLDATFRPVERTARTSKKRTLVLGQRENPWSLNVSRRSVVSFRHNVTFERSDSDKNFKRKERTRERYANKLDFKSWCPRFYWKVNVRKEIEDEKEARKWLKGDREKEIRKGSERNFSNDPWDPWSMAACSCKQPCKPRASP